MNFLELCGVLFLICIAVAVVIFVWSISASSPLSDESDDPSYWGR